MYPSFKAISVFVLEEGFARFLPYMGVSCELDHLNSIKYPKALEALYEILIQSAQLFQRNLKLWMDGQKAPQEPLVKVS